MKIINKLKIDKITFNNAQCWMVLNDDEENYVGTLHIVKPNCVNYIRDIYPTEMFFDKSLIKAKKMAKVIQVKDNFQEKIK